MCWGWSNQTKIAALESKAKVLQARLAEAGARIAALQEEQQAARERLGALDKLEEYRDFQELDWRTSSSELAVLAEEKQRSGDRVGHPEDTGRAIAGAGRRMG